ncbi:MAG: CoA transferase [Ideonella sp.]|nr:CoA transferase [Ideonella sp.]
MPGAGVLAGVQVLEIAPSPSVSVSFCGMLLADLGADVIVIEPPSNAAGLPRPRKIHHRGKRSVMLDLHAPGAVKQVLSLVDRCDVLIEGMRPGDMEQLGIGPEACLSRRPSLVYGRVTGWGQDGPLARAPACDGDVAAVSGALWLSSPAGALPSAPKGLLGDVCGGALYLALGVLAAALRAQTDGRGQVVDAAAVDGAANLQNLTLSLIPNTGGEYEVRRPDGYRRPWIRSYRCADGAWIRIEPDEPRFYAELLTRIGIADPQRFVDAQKNRALWQQQAAELEAVFVKRTRAQWCELLEGTDACFSPILAPAQAAVHPHNVARGIYQEVDGVLQTAPAPRFSATPSNEIARVPPLGAHTREVLG